jgi:hypothetical protein
MTATSPIFLFPPQAWEVRRPNMLEGRVVVVVATFPEKRKKENFPATLSVKDGPSKKQKTKK